MNDIKLTDKQAKSRRNRNIALGIVLATLVILFYAVTIVKFGQGMSHV